MSQIKAFSSQLPEARKLVRSVREQVSRVVAQNTQLIEESHGRIAASRRLIKEADALLESRPGTGKS